MDVSVKKFKVKLFIIHIISLFFVVKFRDVFFVLPKKNFKSEIAIQTMLFFDLISYMEHFPSKCNYSFEMLAYPLIGITSTQKEVSILK